MEIEGWREGTVEDKEVAAVWRQGDEVDEEPHSPALETDH